MARAMLLHASTMWKDGIDPSLWPMAVQYATNLYNHLPNGQGSCPGDLFTGSTLPRHRLLAIHVWGCPLYVLDPTLQAGNKLHRWQPSSRRGVFMGFSSLHSSNVPLVLNLATGSITPQFHVVFDDYFSTLSSLERENDPPDHWSALCSENTAYIATEATSFSDPTTLFLDDNWLKPDELVLKQRGAIRSASIRQSFVVPKSSSSTVLVGRHRHHSTHLTALDEPVISAPSTESPPVPIVRRESASLAQRELASPTGLSLPLPGPPVSTSVVSLPRIPPSPVIPDSTLLDAISVPPPATTPVSDTVRRSNRFNKGTFSKPRFANESFLSVAFTDLDPLSHAGQIWYMTTLQTCPASGELDTMDLPFILGSTFQSQR